MNDWQDRDGQMRNRGHRDDRSWRGRDRAPERERYDERNHRRTSGFEPGFEPNREGYDRYVDDRGYDRSHGSVGWHDRSERPESHASWDASRSYAPSTQAWRGYSEPFERSPRPSWDLHDRNYQGPYGRLQSHAEPYRGVPSRMMDDHPMASAYRSPAERMGDREQDGRWPEDAWQRQGRGFRDPAHRTVASPEPYRGYEESAPRDWRPDETPFYGVTGSGTSSGALERRGKAPKGYVRSDERLREEICERMAGHGHDWSDVEVQVQGGAVTLTGRVEDRRMRFDAEHIADGVRGVGEITNQIRVGRASTKDDGARENGAREARRASS